MILAPSNTFGIPKPTSSNPPTLMDISNARTYVDQLEVLRRVLPDGGDVAEVVAQAEIYKSAVVIAHQPAGDVAPPWVSGVVLAITTAIAKSNEKDFANIRLMFNHLNDRLFSLEQRYMSVDERLTSLERFVTTAVQPQPNVHNY